jgi:cell division protein ZapA
MSEVALSIGGRVYRVACAPGEEEHISRLGGVINDKLAAMGNLSGHEAQNLLFAALLLADEVHEGRDAAGGSSGEIAAAQAQAQTALGERDELKATLANRDAEFERLQTAQRDAASELESAQARLAELSEQLAERQANESALHTRIEELTAERDQPAAHAPATASPAAGAADLAPALERLAEMLEQTADKLESAAPAS